MTPKDPSRTLVVKEVRSIARVGANPVTVAQTNQQPNLNSYLQNTSDGDVTNKPKSCHVDETKLTQLAQERAKRKAELTTRTATLVVRTGSTLVGAGIGAVGGGWMGAVVGGILSNLAGNFINDMIQDDIKQYYYQRELTDAFDDSELRQEATVCQ